VPTRTQPGNRYAGGYRQRELQLWIDFFGTGSCPWLRPRVRRPGSWLRSGSGGPASGRSPVNRRRDSDRFGYSTALVFGRETGPKARRRLPSGRAGASRPHSFFGTAAVSGARWPRSDPRIGLLVSPSSSSPARESRLGLQRTDAVGAERSLLSIRTLFFGFSSSAAPQSKA